MRSLEARGHVVAIVNAWADDHADDPLLSFVTAIDGALQVGAAGKLKKPLSKLSQVAGQVVAAGAKGLVKQTATRFLGDEATKELAALLGKETSDALFSASKEASAYADKQFDEQAKAFFEKFRAGQRSIGEFRKQLAEILRSPAWSTHRLPLFILVDELDRCRPNYAVSVLERMKHLFEVNEVVFVMATDTGQLQHSIRALYGSEFDSASYLFRFFDQTYRFAKPAIGNFVANHFSDLDASKLIGPAGMKPEEFTAYTFQAFGLALRDQQQCIDIIRNCVTVWQAPSKLHLFLLLPLVIAQQRRLDVEYRNLQERLMQSLGKKTINWQLDFGIHRRDAHHRKDIRDGWEVVNSCVDEFSSRTLLRIVNDFEHEKASTIARIVYDLARMEIDNRTRGDVKSYLLMYPELVRSVGRFTAI